MPCCFTARRWTLSTLLLLCCMATRSWSRFLNSAGECAGCCVPVSRCVVGETATPAWIMSGSIEIFLLATCFVRRVSIASWVVLVSRLRPLGLPGFTDLVVGRRRGRGVARLGRFLVGVDVRGFLSRGGGKGFCGCVWSRCEGGLLDSEER